MKVVIAEPVYPKLKLLIEQNKKDWIIYDSVPKDKADFIKRVKDADIACSYFSKFDDEVLSKSPRLKYLAIAAVGAEASVDMQYANTHGITVMNCPGYNSVAVAEMAVGLAISVNRSIADLDQKMKNGIWGNSTLRRKNIISRKKVGLIGYGNVGKSIHRLLRSWEMDFNTVNSESTAKEVDAVVSQSDILFICCSLNDQTKNLINSERIRMMQPSSIIINLSRGAVVDEDALYESLKSGGIAGAGLDVFVDEPQMTAELPQSIKRFTRLENVVCTPHIGGSTVETGDVLSEMLFQNIESCINGSPINVYKL